MALRSAVKTLVGVLFVGTTAVLLTGCGGVPSTSRVLPPATVAPVSAECTLALTHEADLNVKPLLCPNGGVNVSAWQWYEKGHVNGGPVTWSKTLSLGPEATASEVQQAMCADFVNVYGTNPLTISGGELAAAYYGWGSAVLAMINAFLGQDCPTAG